MANQKPIDGAIKEAQNDPDWIKEADQAVEAFEYPFKLQIWASTDGKNTVQVEFEPGFSEQDAIKAREIVKNTYDWMVKNMGTKPEMWEEAMNSNSNKSTPRCPECGSPMEKRKRRIDGSVFWGCPKYPKCRGTINIEA